MEILKRIVEIDAADEADAIETVSKMYGNCGIILDASDYIETVISVKK